MILHILLKTTLLLLFVTSLQAQISALNCTSMLNEGPSPRGFSATKQQQNKKQKTIFFFFFFFPPQNRGAPYTQVRLIHGDLRYVNGLVTFEIIISSCAFVDQLLGFVFDVHTCKYAD